MNIIIKITIAIFITILLNACGEKHTDGGGHAHEANSSTAQSENEAHAQEAPATIASLTQEQIQTVGITYGTVAMKELTATIRANGTLSVPNNNKANVTSLYGGVVQTIKVQLGDYVRKGETIATIADPRLVQLQEEYLVTSSQIVFAEQEYSRQQELFTNNAGAKKNLQNAASELNTLRTKKASLEKQVALMGVNPSKLSNDNLRSGLAVTAPISGTISNMLAKIGSYIDVSSPVAEIVDNSSLHLDLQVFEKDLPQIKVGQVIHFTITNNPVAEYDATVFSIGASFENDSKTVAVHCKVTGKKNGLIDGMNITGIVSLSNVTTPAVPNDAIVSADGKNYIFIVTDKKSEVHHETKGGAHSHDDEKENHGEAQTAITNFKKIQVTTGVSDMGYTAIIPINEIPQNAKIITKGAFFVNARLSNTGGHAH